MSQLKNLEYSQNTEELDKKIYLADKLIKYFDKAYKDDIKAAFNLEKEYKEIIDSKMLDFEKDFKDISDNCLDLLEIKFKNGNNSIQEYRTLKKYFKGFNQFYNEKTDKNGLIQLMDSLSENEIKEFRFDVKPSETAHYFNLRLFKLEKLFNRFKIAASSLDKQILRNQEEFKSIDNDISAIQKEFDTICIDPKYKISYKLYNDISFVGVKEKGKAELVEDIKLSEIEERTESKSKKIKANLKDIFNNINSVENTLKEEIELLKAIEGFKKNIDIVKEIFDLDWLQDYVNNFQEDLFRIETEYLNSDPLELKKRDEKVAFIVELWRTNLENKYNNGIKDVWKYFISEIQNDISKMEKSIRTVNHIQKNAGKDFEEEDKEEINDILNNLKEIKSITHKPLEKQQPASQTTKIDVRKSK